jgi:GntR family transcriptional regulator, transcriptional repressor for pyruvate dehydrogenase complex
VIGLHEHSGAGARPGRYTVPGMIRGDSEKLDNRINVRERARRQTGKIAAYINDQIASGAWGPGHRLPTDRELAQSFGVARNTVRRTLERLEREQLIVRHVGRGSFVAGELADDSHDSHGDTSPSDIMELRLLIEPQMAELIVLRATARDIDTLEECIRKSEAARSYHEFEKWDEALHHTLAHCTKNNGVLALMDSINVQRNQPAWIYLKKQSLTHGNRQTYERQHRAIVDAVRKRDRTLTQESIRTHLLEVRRNLLGSD